MSTEAPGEKGPRWDSLERRIPGREAERSRLRPEEIAVLIRERRFSNNPPENLDAEQFSSSKLKTAVIELFVRLEGKLDRERVAQLKASFERSIAIWEEAGLFTAERREKGYEKPDFDRDYLSSVTPATLEMMEEGTALDRGYDAPVFTPKDLPVYSKDPEQPSYFKILKEALLSAYNGTAGGKAPQTLLIGPEKQVFAKDKIDPKEILWRWERYLKAGVVHNPKDLDPEKHGGITEAEVLKGLKGVEEKTGGTMRLERTKLVMPRDVGKDRMSPQDWEMLLKRDENPLPREASADQDVKQAMAFVMYCLETQGWIPDFYDWNNPGNSQVALALKTYVPDESAAGAVAALDWDVNGRRFGVVRFYADLRLSLGGVRPGVRMGYNLGFEP